MYVSFYKKHIRPEIENVVSYMRDTTVLFPLLYVLEKTVVDAKFKCNVSAGTMNAHTFVAAGYYNSHNHLIFRLQEEADLLIAQETFGEYLALICFVTTLKPRKCC